MLAVRLLHSKPHTSEHCNRWSAFRLGSVLLADIWTATSEEKTSAAQVSEVYLSYLSSAAYHMKMRVLIPPLDWPLDRWDRDVERTYDALEAPPGVSPQEMTEDILLEYMASNTVQVNDRRVWDARYLARTAFRILGQGK